MYKVTSSMHTTRPTTSTLYTKIAQSYFKLRQHSMGSDLERPGRAVYWNRRRAAKHLGPRRQWQAASGTWWRWLAVGQSSAGPQPWAGAAARSSGWKGAACRPDWGLTAPHLPRHLQYSPVHATCTACHIQHEKDMHPFYTHEKSILASDRMTCSRAI